LLARERKRPSMRCSREPDRRVRSGPGASQECRLPGGGVCCSIRWRDDHLRSGRKPGDSLPYPGGCLSTVSSGLENRCAVQTVPGVRIPPSPLQKAKNGASEPGPGGRVLTSFGRVRGQLGGKVDRLLTARTH